MSERGTNAPDGGDIDSLKMRNTDTSVLKRMPTAANSSSASSAVRKTIKLKPLTPTPDNKGKPMLHPAAAPPPSILQTRPVQPGNPAMSTPQSMPANTVPLTKAAKPQREMPFSAPGLGGASASPASQAAPSAATVRLVSPSAAPAATAMSTATVTIPRIKVKKSEPGAAVPTVKLPRQTPMPSPRSTTPQYISTATTHVPPMRKPLSGVPNVPERANQAQSGVLNAQGGGRLHPSASPNQQASSLNASSPAIRLAPRTESAVTPMPSVGENAAADAQAARPKIQLKKGAGEQPLLRKQGDINNPKIGPGAGEAEQVIKQKINTEKKGAKGKKTLLNVKNEPNVFFALCAIVAFLVICYTVFALAAQYLTVWEEKPVPVYGFQELNEQLGGQVK